MFKFRLFVPVDKRPTYEESGYEHGPAGAAAFVEKISSAVEGGAIANAPRLSQEELRGVTAVTRAQAATC